MQRRAFLSLATIAVLLGGRSVAAQPAGNDAAALFSRSFPNQAGQDVAMSSYLGAPVLINFWATWCPPCVKEMPDLDELSRRHPDVRFVGLAVDTAVNVEKFQRKVQVDYPLLITGHGGISLMRELGNKTGGLPYTLVFDARGRVLKQYLGQIDPKEIDQYLATNLTPAVSAGGA